MTKRIFRTICATSLACLLLLAAGVVGLVYKKSTAECLASLKEQTVLISTGLETAGTEYLAQLKGINVRITLISADGSVIFDDRSAADEMEAHADRPEVISAFKNGDGSAQRKSQTLGKRTIYYAKLLSGGTVLRLSMQTASIWAEALRFVPWLILIAFAATLFAAFIAKKRTRIIVEPINNINLDNPFEGNIYEELSPVVRRIAAQKAQIEEQISTLKQSQNEFEAITQNMNEGLIVTDSEANVLTINNCAKRILGIENIIEAAVPILELSRNLQLEEAAKNAAAGKRTETTLPLAGRQFRLVASPANRQTSIQNAAYGAVLLLMDDTEKISAETSRREFSANVSHELKTPLTSISGYAEIIKNGIAKPEDINNFAGKIYDESARLISLIEDIIRLSKLDEQNSNEINTEVDLHELAQQAVEHYANMAQEKEISLNLNKSTAFAHGSKSILSEILFNLIENAIRYSNNGAKIDVATGKNGNECFIRVADTGIGIAPEEQEHIFERFYRVEKSHARESGGTGLGLSIVKRGAMFHGGRVELNSALGKGSEFIVWIPR